MKSIAYFQYGPPEVLRIEEREKPTPKGGEILVRVHGAAVNYGDVMARNFKNITARAFNMPGFLLLPVKVAFGLKKPKRQILGNELSGVVEAAGAGVSKFKPGDEVFAYRGMEMGAHAEYICISENKAVALKPTRLSHAEAACLPYGGIMALGLLRKAAIQPGQKVLIVGASGGIGSVALQLALFYGAEAHAVCSTPGLEYVRALGAHRAIDYTREDFTRNGEKYDLIFDVLGRVPFARCKPSLRPNGRVVYASFKTKQLLQMAWTSIAGGRKAICATAAENAADLELIGSLAEAGKIRVVVDRVFSPEQAAEAHRYVENGGKKGGVAIDFG